MFGLRWLARRQHRRVSNMKIQLQKDFEHTKQVLEEGWKKNIERIQKAADDDRARDKKEFDKTIAELQKKIDEKLRENQELQETHRDIQNQTVRRFEHQENARIQEFLILKDEVEEERRKGKDFRVFWEEMIEFLKRKGHEMINQTESDQIIYDEIMKRIAIIAERSDNKYQNLEDIRKHMQKTLKKAPQLEGKEINVQPAQFSLKPEEK